MSWLSMRKNIWCSLNSHLGMSPWAVFLIDLTPSLCSIMSKDVLFMTLWACKGWSNYACLYLSLFAWCISSLGLKGRATLFIFISLKTLSLFSSFSLGPAKSASAGLIPDEDWTESKSKGCLLELKPPPNFPRLKRPLLPAPETKSGKSKKSWWLTF